MKISISFLKIKYLFGKTVRRNGLFKFDLSEK